MSQFTDAIGATLGHSELNIVKYIHIFCLRNNETGKACSLVIYIHVYALHRALNHSPLTILPYGQYTSYDYERHFVKPVYPFTFDIVSKKHKTHLHFLSLFDTWVAQVIDIRLNL